MRQSWFRIGRRTFLRQYNTPNPTSKCNTPNLKETAGRDETGKDDTGRDGRKRQDGRPEVIDKKRRPEDTGRDRRKTKIRQVETASQKRQ